MSQWKMFDEWVARNCPETAPTNPTRAQRRGPNIDVSWIDEPFNYQKEISVSGIHIHQWHPDPCGGIS